MFSYIANENFFTQGFFVILQNEYKALFFACFFL